MDISLDMGINKGNIKSVSVWQCLYVLSNMKSASNVLKLISWKS